MDDERERTSHVQHLVIRRSQEDLLEAVAAPGSIATVKGRAADAEMHSNLRRYAPKLDAVVEVSRPSAQINPLSHLIDCAQQRRRELVVPRLRLHVLRPALLRTHHTSHNHRHKYRCAEKSAIEQLP